MLIPFVVCRRLPRQKYFLQPVVDARSGKLNKSNAVFDNLDQDATSIT
jgi:hypothetical protein